MVPALVVDQAVVAVIARAQQPTRGATSERKARERQCQLVNQCRLADQSVLSPNLQTHSLTQAAIRNGKPLTRHSEIARFGEGLRGRIRVCAAEAASTKGCV